MCERRHFWRPRLHNPSNYSSPHICLRGTDVKYASTDRWWSRDFMADSPQHHVAGEVENKQTSRFQWHNQCATLHVAINRLSIILVLPNTVVFQLQFCCSVIRLGHGVGNLHTPWLGLITCDTLEHSYWFPFRRLWVASEWQLAGANICLVATEHKWKWKPRAGPHHIPAFQVHASYHATSLVDVTITRNK